MKISVVKTDYLLSFFFGVLIFGFYFYYYPYHIHYQEQFQLFLNTSDYLAERTSKPGGFAEYIAGFLTQFFYYRWVGALFIALLLVFIQRLVQSVSFAFRKNTAFALLSFLPSVLYWSLLCDENYMLGGVVAVVLGLLPLPRYQRIKSYPVRLAYLLVILPVLYWLAGGIVIVSGLLLLVWECTHTSDSPKQKAGLTLVVCLLLVGLPLFAQTILVQYPVMQLIKGVDYYRYTQLQTMPIAIIALSLLITPVLFLWLPQLTNRKSSLMAFVFQLLLLIAGGGYLISQTVSWEKEEVMAYDYHVRMQNWEAVIRMADKQTPTSSLSVSCLNLALAKQGILGDRMFHYYQNGTAGLFPHFSRDFTIPFVGGEVYYQLGFINTAQRYAFEAMEALPDYQKSVRAIKRLAETNIINGEYTVARKYLRLLQQTTLYKKWADNTLLTLRDESTIASHPEWATLRELRTKTDFLFSESEKDMMLGIVLQQNPTHRMVYEYLMAYCLLTKDLKHFKVYFPLGKKIGYKQIPIHYQEALIYIWGLSNADPTQNIPYPINNEVKANVKIYGNIYTTYQNPEPMLREAFSGTYWYYLHFRKHNKTIYEDLYDVYADVSSPVSPGV